MKKLTVREIEYIAFKMAKEKMTYNEPIPDFGTRFQNKLESCLATPFQSFGGKSLYSSFLSKAAILLYLMIKNHPFQNGNKRIAITTLLLFLAKNNKWLEVGIKEFYNFTLWVTQSPAELKDETVEAIEKFLKNHLINF